VLPPERTWTVTFLGLGRTATVAGPTDRPLRVEAGANPVPRTAERRERLFALLNAAQYEHEAKAAAWRTLESARAPEEMLAELHAQGLPRALIGALAEVLTSR
jgi:hypothetical protein